MFCALSETFADTVLINRLTVVISNRSFLKWEMYFLSKLLLKIIAPSVSGSMFSWTVISVTHTSVGIRFTALDVFYFTVF